MHQCVFTASGSAECAKSSISITKNQWALHREIEIYVTSYASWGLLVSSSSPDVRLLSPLSLLLVPYTCTPHVKCAPSISINTHEIAVGWTAQFARALHLASGEPNHATVGGAFEFPALLFWEDVKVDCLRTG